MAKPKKNKTAPFVPGAHKVQITDDTTCSRQDMAKLLDMSPYSLSRLIREGEMPPPVYRGEHHVLATMVARLRFLQGKIDGTADQSKTDASRRVLDERAKKLERERELAEGTVISIEAIGAEVEEMLATTRARLIAMAGNLAATITGETNPGVVQDAVMDEINAVLNELSYEATPSVASPPATGARARAKAA